MADLCCRQNVLAGAKGDLQTLIDRNREAELKALATSEAALARLNEAQTRFVMLDQAKVSPAQRSAAKANLDVAQADELAARTEVDRLRRMIELGSYGLQLWDARAEIYATPKPDAARLEEIAQRVRTGLVRVRQARDLLRESLATREQEAFDLRESLLTEVSPLDKRSIAARLKAATAQTDADRLVMVALEKFEQYLTGGVCRVGGSREGSNPERACGRLLATIGGFVASGLALTSSLPWMTSWWRMAKR